MIIIFLQLSVLSEVIICPSVFLALSVLTPVFFQTVPQNPIIYLGTVSHMLEPTRLSPSICVVSLEVAFWLLSGMNSPYSRVFLSFFLVSSCAVAFFEKD